MMIIGRIVESFNDPFCGSFITIPYTLISTLLLVSGPVISPADKGKIVQIGIKAPNLAQRYFLDTDSFQDGCHLKSAPYWPPS
jgi:hypothetical protein